MTRIVTLFRRLPTKPSLILLFILCALPAGLVMALLTPAGQAPDEAAHMARADGLLHGAVLAVRKPAVQANGIPLLYTGVKLNGRLFQVSFGQTTAIGDRLNVETKANADAIAKIAWDAGTVYADIPNTATYFPVFYLPAAAGLEAGILSRQSPYHTMLTARLFMLVGFLTLGTAALWVAAYGEALLLAVLLLPMTLFLASTLNPDGMIIASACLAAAALTRGVGGLARRPAALWLAALMLVLITTAKLPYLPLLGFLLLPFVDLRRRLGVAVLALLPIMLWVVLLAGFSTAPFGKPPYHPGPLWTGNHDLLFYQTYPATNLHILLRHPALLFSLPWNDACTNGVRNMHGAIGILGTLELGFPNQFYTAWVAALIVAAVAALLVTHPAVALAPRHALLVSLAAIVLLIGTWWAIDIAMYINWTNVGNAQIDGLQGRYYTPLLPFLVLAIPAWRRPGLLPGWAPALPVVALGIFDLGYLPQQLVTYFYLH